MATPMRGQHSFSYIDKDYVLSSIADYIYLELILSNCSMHVMKLIRYTHCLAQLITDFERRAGRLACDVQQYASIIGLDKVL